MANNYDPKLLCTECRLITTHQLKGERAIAFRSWRNKLRGYEQIYTCLECGSHRRWGLNESPSRGIPLAGYSHKLKKGIA